MRFSRFNHGTLPLSRFSCAQGLLRHQSQCGGRLARRSLRPGAITLHRPSLKSAKVRCQGDLRFAALRTRKATDQSSTLDRVRRLPWSLPTESPHPSLSLQSAVTKWTNADFSHSTIRYKVKPAKSLLVFPARARSKIRPWATASASAGAPNAASLALSKRTPVTVSFWWISAPSGLALAFDAAPHLAPVSWLPHQHRRDPASLISKWLRRSSLVSST